MSLPKQRPLIGLTGPLLDERPGSWHAVPNAYVQAVYAAGGMPVHIPCLPGEEVAAELLGRLDGLVLTGGGDVDPFHFGESPHPALGRICPRRDALELPLVRAALAADLPLLAICRGIQVLNIATGGTVYQDLGSQLANPLQHVQNAPRWYPTHAVELSPDSRLYA
ncbi:MAG TPA: gamma-glutamyl-gamma-aminobutyrate hydrolase family protein, partial [Bacillota bacterium]